MIRGEALDYSVRKTTTTSPNLPSHDHDETDYEEEDDGRWIGSILERLDISHNHITSLSSLSTNHHIFLKSVNASYNTISSLSSSSLSSLHHLTSLNLSHNSLTSIDGLNCGLFISFLDVSHNSLSSLSSISFLPYLRYLNISHNLISSLSSLSHINQQQDNDEMVDGEMQKEVCEELQTLICDGNPISSLSTISHLISSPSSQEDNHEMVDGGGKKMMMKRWLQILSLKDTPLSQNEVRDMINNLMIYHLISQSVSQSTISQSVSQSTI